MTKLEDNDAFLIRLMRKEGVLEDIQKRKLPGPGCILITCPDARRFPDIYDYKHKLFRRRKQGALIHPLTRHFGPGVLAPKCPAVKAGRSIANDLVDEINDAIEILEVVSLVVGEGHWPCSKAKKHGIELLEAIRYFFTGKEVIRAKCNKAKTVVILFHVDYGPAKRTYYINYSRFVKWLDEKNRLVKSMGCGDEP